MYASGRFLWEGTIHYEFDGVERDNFPPSRQHRVGPYVRLSDTSFTLDYVFRARLDPSGDRIELTDRTGAFNGARFEFHRR